MNHNIWVVRVASLEGLDYRTLCDDILESVHKGMLVLGVEDTLEVMELPLPGSVEVQPLEEPAAPKPEKPKTKADQEYSARPSGRNADEKRAIMERLKAYRETHGLGCWAEVSKASGGKLSEDALREMKAGTAALPISVWRLAAKSLDKAEKAH